jgi:hypothetical protein
MRSLLLATACLILAAFPAAPRADDDFQAIMHNGIQGHWKQLGDGDQWWDIAPDLVVKTDKNGRSQRYLGFRLNANHNPAWLDLLYKQDGEVKLALGIAHWKGNQLIWVEGDHVDVRRYAVARGDLPRPDDFNAPKAKRHMLVRPAQNPRW